MAIISTFIANNPTPFRIGGEPIIVHKVLDFSVTNAAASDVIEAINVAANVTCLRFWTRVATVEGGTMTFDVGDGDDPNGYDDAVDGNAAPSNGAMSGIATVGTDAYALGKKYTTADTIDVTLDDAADAMVLVVYAELVKDESSS